MGGPGSKGNLALSKIFKRAEDIRILGGRTVQELGDNGILDLSTFITKLSNQELVTASISDMGMGMGMGNRDNNPNNPNRPNRPTKSNRPTHQ